MYAIRSYYVLGGAAVTEEQWPGYQISSASYVVSLMPPRIVSELELERFGYRVSILDPDYWVPFSDGNSLTLWGDARKTAEEIRITSYNVCYTKLLRARRS